MLLHLAPRHGLSKMSDKQVNVPQNRYVFNPLTKQNLL